MGNGFFYVGTLTLCRCGHCKRLKPEYAVAAGILKNDDPAVALVKVDCTEAGKTTCEQYSVSGYPTLKIFRKGELSSEYNGPRESSKLTYPKLNCTAPIFICAQVSFIPNLNILRET